MTFELSESDSRGPTFRMCEPIFDIATCDSFIVSLLERCDSGIDSEPKVNGDGFRRWSLPAVSPTQEASKKDADSLLATMVYPNKLQLVPTDEWKNQENVCLKSLIESHFRARSTRRLRFEHKLWNALAITKQHPELMSIIGISWETENIIRVTRDIFGALLGLTRPTAALFNPQGSFHSHGFTEVLIDNKEDLDRNARFFVHSSGKFNQFSTPEDLLTCKWQTRSKIIGTSV